MEIKRETNPDDAIFGYEDEAGVVRHFRRSNIKFHGQNADSYLLKLADDTWLLLTDFVVWARKPGKGVLLSESDAIQWLLRNGCTPPECNSFHELEIGLESGADPGIVASDRDPTETSEAGTTDLRPTGAVPPLILNPLQTQILKVLKGKALRTQALAGACGVEKNKLYQKLASGLHPIQELKDAGFVVLSSKIGYYRPDAPPPEVTQNSTQ